MQEKFKQVIKKITESKKPISVISHFDTDGITSAAIFSKALERKKIKFSLQIIKGLEPKFIETLPKENLIIFLDLASNSLQYIKQETIIIDHHEISASIPDNILMVNPMNENHENLCTAALCYLFAKTLSPENTDLATLAVLGMVGDIHDQNLSKHYDEIVKDSGTTVKKGPLIYPSTRPLNKALEYSSSPYIPGVSGSFKGAIELLREANIPQVNKIYKSLYELTDEEMTSLITAIMLRCTNKTNTDNLVGNLYLVKFHNKQEDARELSALINACSRMDHPEISLGFCLGSKSFKEKGEKIYREYKQHLVSALKFVSTTEKISGKNYTIINAKDNVKDTIIGTVASIISHSPLYKEGTIIIALAHNENKIKVSARIAGKEGQNVREILTKVTVPLGGEVGGHKNAAGCLILKEQETQFIAELQKVLSIQQ
jgi:single-stranded-DNA-specific exonuclease